jgi:hypothetical protein
MIEIGARGEKERRDEVERDISKMKTLPLNSPTRSGEVGLSADVIDGPSVFLLPNQANLDHDFEEVIF